jgi:hypothetical protein
MPIQRWETIGPQGGRAASLSDERPCFDLDLDGGRRTAARLDERVQAMAGGPRHLDAHAARSRQLPFTGVPSRSLPSYRGARVEAYV